MHSLLEAIHMLFKGNIAKDKRTKDLAKRIKPGEIAIIDHKKFNRPLHQELLITLGGVMINLIFGSVCFILYLIFATPPRAYP